MPRKSAKMPMSGNMKPKGMPMKGKMMMSQKDMMMPEMMGKPKKKSTKKGSK